MEKPVKSVVLGLTAVVATSVQAFAHSGHIPAVGSSHAVEHVASDGLVVAMTLVALGVGVMVTARIRRRDR